jgi:hypothetical protein
MSTNTTALYSIFVCPSAVVLRPENGFDERQGRLLSTHRCYDSAYELALDLAGKKGLQFINHVDESAIE